MLDGRKEVVENMDGIMCYRKEQGLLGI